MNYLTTAFILPMLAAAWLLWIGSIMSAKGWASSLMFKTVPIGLSFALVLYALKVI